MKRVITLAREHGSGGREIAGRVAEALGWKVIDRQVVAEVARLAQVPPEEIHAYDEHVNPWVLRLAKGLWSGAPDAFSTPAPGEILDADRIAELTRRAIHDAAEAGSCVIVGRGAQCALGRRPDVLRVFVYAPVEDRLARIAARIPHGTDAEAEIERVDRSRAAYVRHYYHRGWGDRDCYELMVNSAVGIEAAARTILCAAGFVGAPR